VIRNVDKVQRGLVDKILIAGHAPDIAAGNQLQRVRGGVVKIGPGRQRDIEVDLLRIHRRRRGASAVGTVHAVSRPQQAGQHAQRQFLCRELAGRVPLRDRLHQRHAARFVGDRQRNRWGSVALRRPGAQSSHRAERQLGQGTHRADLLLVG
jgi:hypothetical protein